MFGVLFGGFRKRNNFEKEQMNTTSKRMNAQEAQAFIESIEGVEIPDYTELTTHINSLRNADVQVGPYWLKLSLEAALRGEHCNIVVVSLHGTLKHFEPATWSPKCTAYVAYTNRRDPA